MTIEMVFILIGLAVLIAPLIFRAMRQNRAHREQQEKIAQQLAGRDTKAVIEASPFSYANWQGESGYRILDERKDPPFIGFAGTVDQAENQILLLISAESSAQR